MLDEDDLVGGGEYEWAGGRDDRGAAGAGRGEAGDDARLGVRVDGAGRPTSSRISDPAAGREPDEALALATGEGPAAFLDPPSRPSGRPEDVPAGNQMDRLRSASSVIGCKLIRGQLIAESTENS